MTSECRLPNKEYIVDYLNEYHAARGELIYEEWGINAMVAARVAGLVFFPETMSEDIEGLVFHAVNSNEIKAKGFKKEGLEALKENFLPPIEDLANEVLSESISRRDANVR